MATKYRTPMPDGFTRFLEVLPPGAQVWFSAGGRLLASRQGVLLVRWSDHYWLVEFERGGGWSARLRDRRVQSRFSRNVVEVSRAYGLEDPIRGVFVVADDEPEVDELPDFGIDIFPARLPKEALKARLSAAALEQRSFPGFRFEPRVPARDLKLGPPDFEVSPAPAHEVWQVGFEGSDRLPPWAGLEFLRGVHETMFRLASLEGAARWAQHWPILIGPAPELRSIGHDGSSGVALDTLWDGRVVRSWRGLVAERAPALYCRARGTVFPVVDMQSIDVGRVERFTVNSPFDALVKGSRLLVDVAEMSGRSKRESERHEAEMVEQSARNIGEIARTADTLARVDIDPNLRRWLNTSLEYTVEAQVELSKKMGVRVKSVSRYA